MKFYVLLAFQLCSCFSFSTKPRLTLDEFFDSTVFTQLSYSPTGQHLLLKTIRPSWNTSVYENTLWLYDIHHQTKQLVTKNPHQSIKPKWSPSGKWILLALDETPPDITNAGPYRRSFDNDSQVEQHIYLYSLVSNDLLPIEIGTDIPLALAWSDNDLLLYLATTDFSLPEEEEDDEEEWKDVMQYRENKKYLQSIIYRIDISEHNHLLSVKRNTIRHVSFLITELLFVPFGEKLLFTSASLPVENSQDLEIYSINLHNTSSLLTRLTDNEVSEGNLQLSIDGTHVLFQTTSLGSIKKEHNNTQARLYTLDLVDGQITRLAHSFDGSINEYIIRSDGGIYILGQLGTEIQIYLQQSLSDDLIPIIGWNGTYESIAISKEDFIAFVYSSTQKPMEVYLVNNIDQLQSARALTSENKLFTERDLPQTKVYQWKNEDDYQIVEGMLHYPPGKFEAKNLPLLVLIHGGPYAASINQFRPDWYTWAPLAASEGWLVLEPNYRGSSGYGDQFLQEIRYRPLSLSGKDILSGVDQLIRDGIVDPYRLAVGGYSYGGFLTNWLITQTKRFNAALSGAGAVDHLSAWGIMDLPVFLSHIYGGFPWDVPHVYQNEAPIYQLDRVSTPTLITAGESDIRVPTSQSYILERGLYYRGVPVKLITFPHEGHELQINPWHGKIKVREELKWLKKYGNQFQRRMKN